MKILFHALQAKIKLQLRRITDSLFFYVFRYVSLFLGSVLLILKNLQKFKSTRRREQNGNGILDHEPKNKMKSSLHSSDA